MLRALGSRLYAWVDERAGVGDLLKTALDEPVPGGSSMAYVFGSGLVFLFILQAVTGMFLAMYYVPSAEDAHRTVEFISKEVTFGWFVRGIHHYGSSAMMILLALHVLQVVIWGAYKRKRELVWLAGFGLLQLILFFSLSGYLLPWDMKAYFGTQVTVNIASEIPFIGDSIKRVMQGGPILGTLTLSRFFMVHVFLLPALTVGGIGLHVYLFRRAKPAGPFHLSEEEAERRTERFYPKQLFKDAAFSLILFGILATLAILFPAPLEPKADPSDTTYIARPEWYFLSLFQLLKYFQGSFAAVGSLVIPGIVMTAVALLPFLDRSPERRPQKRPVVMAAFGCLLIAVGTLMWMAKSEDRAQFGPQFAKQADDGRKLMAQPFKPKEIGGGGPAKKAPPPEAFTARCAMCHGQTGMGGPAGPKLAGTSRSRDDIMNLVENPTAFGAAKMPPVTGLTPEERAKIADWIKSLGE